MICNGDEAVLMIDELLLELQEEEGDDATEEGVLEEGHEERGEGGERNLSAGDKNCDGG